ncbi:MAG: glycosyltransferase [Paracoccaceae bacterium]|nr:glycosyltransferase [Paracoccaceae bacterium]
MVQLSVIVPAYRPSDFDALRASMAANGDVAAEWIVVDDGSGPEFDPVFATLNITGTRVVRPAENRRQGAARNTGLSYATGPWVKFLDADDGLNSGHLIALLEAARGAKEGVIPFAPTRHIFPSGRSVVNDSWRDLPHEPHAQLERLLKAPFLHHCGALFPRGLLEQLGGYDEGLETDEDGDLLIRTLLAGFSFVAVPQAEYLYIHHEGSRVSTDDNPRKIAARERVCDRLQAAFLGREMPPAIRTALAQRLDRIAMSAWERDPATGARLLGKARRICPNYPLPERLPVRVLRGIGGPRFATSAVRLFRRARSRPQRRL